MDNNIRQCPCPKVFLLQGLVIPIQYIHKQLDTGGSHLAHQCCAILIPHYYNQSVYQVKFTAGGDEQVVLRIRVEQADKSQPACCIFITGCSVCPSFGISSKKWLHKVEITYCYEFRSARRAIGHVTPTRDRVAHWTDNSVVTLLGTTARSYSRVGV